MANVGNADYEYDGGNTRGDDNSPDSPLVTTAGIGNSVERYGDAALDKDGARGVEVLGDEEVLLPRNQFRLFQVATAEGESTHLGSVHDITLTQVDSKLTRSEKTADNT
jgi:hypothetical protein